MAKKKVSKKTTKKKVAVKRELPSLSLRQKYLKAKKAFRESQAADFLKRFPRH